jgi:hypothetical protein
MPKTLTGNGSGCNLSNMLGDELVSKPKRTLLPVLTVLFLISYGLLTMLVVEQSKTIDSQRSLIQNLFQDSVQLTTLKGKAIQKQNADAQARLQNKAPAARPAPQADAPAQNRNSSKFRRPLPQRPPKDTSGEGDQRRMLISI